MAGDSQQGKKKKKKRQQVRRHYRPSLGRYVDTYKRRGDPAALKKKAALRAAAEAEAEAEFEARSVPSSPCVAERRRRTGVWIAVVLLLVAPLMAAGVLLAIRHGTREIDFEIRAALDPVIVQLSVGRPGALVEIKGEARRSQVNGAVKRVTSVLERYPRRLVVLELDGLPLTFHALRPAHQRTLHEHLGSGAGVIYEASLAGFLEDVIDAVVLERPDAFLSVRGLPVEPRTVDRKTARITNGRYSTVIRALDPFVSDHSLLMADTSLTEELIALKALPEGLHHRNHRPILFRTNGRWRVLYDLGEPAPLGLATGSIADHAAADS